MGEDSISFKFKENWQESKKWFYIALGLMLVILILGTYIRTTNIPQLKDVTTGEYTLGPDLDPFLYLRLAHEIVDFGKQLNPDYMRYLGMVPPYIDFVQWGIVYLYKFLSLFSKDISLEYAAIIFPVIFFGFSIVVFFFFIREIFYKKEEFQKNLVAVIATAIYAVIPLMQHRTTAGVPELESAGVFFFWISFLFFLKAWHDDKKLLKINRSYLLAFASGIATAFMIFTWGGFRFIFYSLSLATLISLLIGKVGRKETIVYGLWFIPSFLFSIFKSGIREAAFDITYAAIPLFVFLVLMLNLFLGEMIGRKARDLLKKEWITKEIASLVTVLFIGILAVLILDSSLLVGIFQALKAHLLNPFASGRAGLTVAENQQLYLTDLFSNFGVSFFWMFFFGLIFLFYETIRNLEKKDKIVLTASFVIFLAGFIFSRYSPNNAIFNGVHPISQAAYFGAMIVLSVSLIYVYSKNLRKDRGLEKFKEVEFSYIFSLILIMLMIVAARGAIRLLVIASPVFIISMAFFPVALIGYRMKTKEDLLKFFLLLMILASFFYVGYIFKNYEAQTATGVKYTITGDPYTTQWQYAMAWVRENTPEKSIFIHWWDYGYWIQTIGKRPTVTDGGHTIPYWDHLTGRYLLTTQKPETALSLMKSYNVSYLLIDSTDMGKYSAYSIIGSDSTSKDRFAQIPVMVLSPSQTREKNSSEIRIYQGATFVDEDIIFGNGTDKVFLPSEKAGVIGVIVEILKDNSSASFNQPQAVFVYNQKQILVPVRYLQYENRLLDFGGGLDATIKIIPQVSRTSNQQGLQIDKVGAAIYLSPKVSKGLFAQVYLLNDPFKKYETIKLVHSEQDSVVENLNQQGANVGEMIYFGGFRGPLKIWEVDYPANILSREEFLRTSGKYAEFDNLTFTE